METPKEEVMKKLSELIDIWTEALNKDKENKQYPIAISETCFKCSYLMGEGSFLYQPYKCCTGKCITQNMSQSSLFVLRNALRACACPINRGQQ